MWSNNLVVEYRRHNIFHSKMSEKKETSLGNTLNCSSKMVPECTGTERRRLRLDGERKDGENLIFSRRRSGGGEVQDDFKRRASDLC